LRLAFRLRDVLLRFGLVSTPSAIAAQMPRWAKTTDVGFP
jgi:hypothetical protein